jgi:hypothetical protein
MNKYAHVEHASIISYANPNHCLSKHVPSSNDLNSAQQADFEECMARLYKGESIHHVTQN